MAIDLGDNPVGTPPTEPQKIQIRDVLGIKSAALREEAFFATSAALNEKADKVSPSLGLKNLNDSDLLDTIVSVNGTYLQGTSLNWPDVNYSDSTPVWWNVQTFGESNRITQIAHYGFSVNDATKRIFWRMKHDADWSEWRQIALISDISGGGVIYQGGWNATTNSPTIPAAAAGNKGWYYIVTTAGSTSVGGITDWKVGDWVISDGTAWTKVDNTDQVTSVAGKTGVVTLTSSDVGLGNVPNVDATNRANHTGTQDQSTVVNLTTDLAARALNTIAVTGTGMLAGGGDLTINRTITLAATAAFTVLMNNTSASAVPTAVTMASLKTALALTKADIGLGNVDNTSDINKPISTATQTALNGKGAIINWSTLSGTSPALTFADGPKAHTLTLSGNTTFSASGYTQGRMIELFLTGHASNQYNLTWPANWKWLEGAPANLAATKAMRVSLICTGGTDTTVFAVYAVQP